MKKLSLLVLLLSLFMLLACGCASDPKNFSEEDLTITLTKSFESSHHQGFDIYLESDDVIFSAVRESATDLEYAGYEITSLNDYSIEIAELNGCSQSTLNKRNDYYYFTTSNITSDANYTYVHCMFAGKDAYWICEFVCKTKNYDRFKDKIFKWADSIVISR